MYRLIILILCFFISFKLYSQEYGYRKYTVEDGLVQNQVMTLYQDQNGFLWIGSYGGISRFDGLEFENFITDSRKTGVKLFGLAQTGPEKLWIFSPQRIIEYNYKSFAPHFISTDLGRFDGIYWKENDHDLDFLVYDQPSIHEHVKSYRQGFIKNSRLSIGKEVLFTLKTDQEYPETIFLNDTIWINTKDHGLASFSVKTKKFTIVFDKYVKDIILTQQNEILLLCENTIYRKSGSNFVKFFDLNGLDIAQNAFFIFDKAEGLFIISNNGIFYHINNENEIVETRLEDRRYSALIMDHERNIWIGSESGLYKIFSRAWLNYNSGNSGILPKIWSIVEDKDHQLWFGSLTDGLQVYDGKTFEQELNRLLVANPDQFYMGSLVDEHGTIWLNNHPDIILYRDKQLQWPKSLQKELKPMIFYEDNDEDMILAGCMGKVVFIKSDRIIKEIQLKPGKKSLATVAIAKDKNGLYWFGGFNGISLYDGKKEIPLPALNYNFDVAGNALFTDHRKNIWIGNSSGLYVYDYHSLKKIEHPYLNTFITSIDIYSNQKMILGTTNGLCIFEMGAWYRTDSIICRYYNKELGFFGQECGQNGVLIDSKGRIWIPGTNNVVRLNPPYLAKNDNPPRVFIKEFLKLNDNLEWSPIDSVLSSSTARNLKYNLNNLKFTFHTSSLKSPERISYRYFLDGYDRQWSQPTKERSAVYSKLKPGNYIFNVVAINEDGVTSEIADSISFRIVPAIWQRIWFIVLISLILLGLVSYIIRKKLLEIQLKRENKMKLDHEITLLKLSSFRNQLDPHFTFNAINSILGLVLKENKADAYRYIQKFSSLLRMIINYSDKISRPLYDELNFVRIYLDIEKLRHPDLVTYEILVDEDTDLNVEVPKMIIQTFVENAVSHGILELPGGGRVTISVKMLESDLLIAIDDNGIGRKHAVKPSRIGNGLGLALLNQYVDLFNYSNENQIKIEFLDKEDEQGNSLGTTVTVFVPLEGNFRVLKTSDQEIREEESRFYLNRVKGIAELVFTRFYKIIRKPDQD